MSVPRGGRLDAVLNAFRVALLTQDAAAQRILASGIEDVLVSLGDIGDALQAEIDALGPDVQPWQIERLDRLRALEEQALRELDDYGQTLNSLLPVAQTNAAAAGAAAASASVQAVAGQAVVASSFRTLSAPALREIIAATSTGPLRDLLDTFGATGSAVLRQTLLDGIGQGRNARVVGDAIQRAVGVSRQRAQVIARTEILRAGKQANLASFAANANLISGWEWHAFKGPRTCSACLIMDGTEFPTSVTFFPGHPQCRCVGAPILRDYPQPKGQTGRDYLESLPEADQRRLLGNGKYDAWKSGELELDDMVAPRYSDQWGTSYQEASLATSQANAAVRRAGGVAGTPVPTPTPAPTSVAPTPTPPPVAVTAPAVTNYPTPTDQLSPQMRAARLAVEGGDNPSNYASVIYDEIMVRSGNDPKQILEYERLSKQIQKLSSKHSSAISRMYSKGGPEGPGGKAVAKIRAELDEVIAKRDALPKPNQPTPEIVRDTLRELRPNYGRGTAQITTPSRPSISVDGQRVRDHDIAIQVLNEQAEWLPEGAWNAVAGWINRESLPLGIVDRGYWGGTNGIFISNRLGLANGMQQSALHELTHAIEDLALPVRKREWEFLLSRISATEKKSYIGKGEAGYEDDFISLYMGKDYDNMIERHRAGIDINENNSYYFFEVLSMVTEMLFTNKQDIFWRDSNHTTFALEQLLWLP